MREEAELSVADDAGERLDVFLADNTEYSRSRIKKLIDGGSVRVDGRVVTKPAYTVSTGERVSLVAETVACDIKPVNIPLDVVYEDGDIAVINKQQGLTVHAGCGTGDETLVNALLYRLGDLSGINGELRPGIVHRIDKNTSGLLVVAKNDFAHLSLAKQIAEKSARRIYAALCEGVFAQTDGSVCQPIGRSRKDRTKMAVTPDGRYAMTRYTVLEQFEKYAYVRFELETGRTHQIRVHAAYLRHPIVGDDVYNPAPCKFRLAGQLLHAEQLTLVHPRTGEEMTFSAPLPAYFDNVLQSLYKSERK